MLRRKYTRDYRIETSLGRKGRMQENVTYIGAYFSFVAEPAAVRRARLRLTVLTTLESLLLLLPLLFHSDYLQEYYTVLPTLLTMLPLYLLWAGIYRIFTADEKLTREHRDKIANRIPAGALLLLGMCVLCAIGSVVFLCLHTAKTIDYIFSLLAVLRIAAAIPIFLLRKSFAAQVLPNPAAPAKKTVREPSEQEPASEPSDADATSFDSSRVDTEE